MRTLHITRSRTNNGLDCYWSQVYWNGRLISNARTLLFPWILLRRCLDVDHIIIRSEVE